jgi:hypothetical protein
MFYEDIIREFNQNKIQFVVVGGVAFNLLGGTRATQDLDLLILMDDDNISRIIDILQKNGYKPRQPVNPLDFTNTEIREKWIMDKNMKAFSLFKDYQSYEQIDIIIDSPVDFENARKDAKVIKVDDLIIPVISINNLIKMKETAGRDIDKLDIKDLKIIMGIKNEK